MTQQDFLEEPECSLQIRNQLGPSLDLLNAYRGSDVPFKFLTAKCVFLFILLSTSWKL